jgi:hypothetical protein
VIRSSCILVCTLVLASAVSASAGIAVGKPTFDPAPNQVVTAGAPVNFSVSGSFKPPDPSGSPWITFVWNFGDGSPTRSRRYDGAGLHTDAFQHTFAQGGIYTVTVTGGHGFDFFGFKFSKTKKFQVAVGCPGADAGPKKCAKGTFAPFAGTWRSPAGGAFDGTDLLLEQVGTKVIGVATIKLPNRDVPVTINGKMSFTVDSGGQDALQVKFKDEIALGIEPLAVKGRLVMSAAESSDRAYRTILLTLTQKDGQEIKGSFFLVESGETTAKLCTALGAGKRKAKPDDLIAFVVAAQNEGVASVPAYFSGWDISVSGGTIEDFAVERGGIRAGNTPSQMTIDFASLGAGKGQNNARAFAFLLVRPNPGSTLVTLDTTTFVREETPDTLTIVQPPPLRRVCVPIVK